MTENRTYRVVQWATGNIGSRALKTIIEHPRYELVGLYVSSPDKVGKDAGELCGLDAIGVAATNSLDEILALKADCVSHMRQGTNVDELVAILSSGTNVVTTRGDFHHPATMPAETRERIEEACRKGGTSIYSTGSNPGFVTEALVLPLLALSRRHDCLTIDEYADMTSRDSPDLLFNVMGYGAEPGQFNQMIVEGIKADFAGSLGQIGGAIAMPIDRFEAIGETSAACSRTEIAAGTIEKGKVAALRITTTGFHDGKPVLRHRANWYCTHDIEDKDWDLRESGWRVRLEGDTPLDVCITYPVSEEEYPLYTPGLTAHRAVNAIPMVCEAEPGIRTTVDMAQVIPVFA